MSLASITAHTCLEISQSFCMAPEAVSGGADTLAEEEDGRDSPQALCSAPKEGQ